jgi:DNA-binding CsgD family transcriptional regulator
MATRASPWLIIPGVACLDHSHQIVEGRQVLGRSPSCDFRLDHPTVSHRHAELWLRDESLSVRDLGSRNGTYVDDILIESTPLAVGQSMRLGLVTLQVVHGPLCDHQVSTEILSPRLPKTLELEARELSGAQHRVLNCLIEGHPEKIIARRLHLSPNTVHSHITAIYRQLGVHSRSEFLSRYLGQLVI